MIITKIRLQEEHPTTYTTSMWPLPSCDFNLDFTAGANGYFLKAVTGLGPPDVISVVEGFDDAGIPVMGSVSEKRLISFRVELRPGIGQSYSSLRDDLYKYMSRSIVVSLMNDSLTLCQITGYIKGFESSYFTETPEVQFNIECKIGELYAPFSEVIPVSTLNAAHVMIAYPDGTAPTGLDLQFTVTVNHSNFEIENHGHVWHSGTGQVHAGFMVTYNFLVGDVVTISTNPKDRRVTMVRSSVTYDLAGYIQAGAVWPKLYSGVNVIHWDILSAWATINSASYVPRYWGV